MTQSVVMVDSHCHVSPCWYEPVESLLFQMDRNGVERAVLVQMNGQADNAYQFEVMRLFPDRFASVVWFQADEPGACDQLRRLADRGISGVRLAPTIRSPGDDALAVWRTASDLGLTVSCGGSTEEFARRQFAELVHALPNLRIVLEHLGGRNNPGADSWEDRRRVFELARFPNVSIKVHGLGEFCRRRLPVVEPFPFERPIPPLLDLAYQAFGANRMMWGSDYPPVSAREGYRNALRLTLAEFASRSEEDRALIFGRVALALFPPRV
ncbi:MAG TPA: amidohydrolase family protein [Gemmatimonadales bacterium]|nr:amidohydrolase family protein [Gemmatimonadales bacterium]